MALAFIARSILRTACLEEMALEVAGATGMLLGLGAAPAALLARSVHSLRPRHGLGLACRGLGLSNLTAAAVSAAGLLYAWHHGDLRNGVPLTITLAITLVVGLWLSAGRDSAPGPTPPSSSRWPWVLLAVGTSTFVVLAGAAFWDANRKVPVPPFDVEVQLTDRAQQSLDAAGETIIVAVYFDGDGTRKRGEDTAPFRDVFLGSHEVELLHPGRVHVTDAKISKEAVGRLSDPNYHFFINVYSGRRVFKDNVLDGGYADGRASDLNPAKPIVVRCRPL
jgi:hypothetical protein